MIQKVSAINVTASAVTKTDVTRKTQRSSPARYFFVSMAFL